MIVCNKIKKKIYKNKIYIQHISINIMNFKIINTLDFDSNH